MKKLIYAADDEETIREILDSFLSDAGYEVLVFPDGIQLEKAYDSRPCDLVILDIMMPGQSGVEICKSLRAKSTVPIILLTAKDDDMDYIWGINSGADDYIIKPFRPSILMSRIKAILRRAEMVLADNAELAADELSFGDLLYSEGDHAVYVNHENLQLTETELNLLRYMLQQQGKAVSREDLLDQVWGMDAELETRVTDETVRRIRKKMKTVGSQVALTTVWGFGYRLEELR